MYERKTTLLCIFLFLLGMAVLWATSNGRWSSSVNGGLLDGDGAGGSSVPQGEDGFKKSETRDSYVMSYGFSDFRGKNHHVTFDITKSDYFSSIERYGYTSQEIDDLVDRRTLEEARERMRRRGIDRYARFSVKDGLISYRYDCPRAERKAVVAECERLMGYLVAGQTLWRAEAYRERGFILENDTLLMDYPGITRRNKPIVEGCSVSLLNAGAGYSVMDYLGLVVAFFQKIRYEVPPSTWRGKEIAGLWVPPEVLVNNHGDCDSKSVAFCSLWQHFPNSPLILIKVPKHVMVGVALTPRPGQQTVRIGNRYYVVCEVAGITGKFPGYQEAVKGTYQYVVVN